MSVNKGKNIKTTRRTGTRKALLQAAQLVFSERSVEGVAIDDIVKKAGVAKGSFYNHFKSKEELALELFTDIRAEAEEKIGRINETVADPARRIARALSVYALLAREDPGRGELIARLLVADTSVSSPVYRGVVDDVSAGLKAGRLAIPTVEVGVLFILGISQMLIRRILAEQSRQTVIMLTQQLVALHLRGLGLPIAEAETIAAQSADEIMCNRTA